MTESVKPLPALKKIPRYSDRRQLANLRLGAKGEQRAVVYLLQHNFTIFETNYRFGHHEVDVIALDVKTREIVFVEVKTRSSASFGDPSLAVGRLKLRSLAQAARNWVLKRKLANDYRFDIISVLPDQIEHLENVTW